MPSLFNWTKRRGLEEVMGLASCKRNDWVKDKFAIIGGDIHKLIRIKEGEKWAHHPWRIPEKDNWFWVPLPDEKVDYTKGKWRWIEHATEACPLCKRNHFYKRMEG